MTNLSPSNFTLIQSEFGNIIRHTRETDKTGKTSNVISRRKTYTLIDGSKLYVTEILKGDKIDYYYYDWVDKDEKDIMRFHSEIHEEKKFQTSTEPFHIHGEKNLNVFPKRFPNYNFRDLFHIFELIRIIFIYEKILV
ncbi:MAG: DUF6516 family protein [Bacillota bacterium]|nr:DUF6516 family protein [Bacillota bacterium]